MALIWLICAYIWWLGVDKKTSVLDYVVKSIIAKGTTAILDVTDDVSSAGEASRLSGRDMMHEVEAIISHLKYMEEERKSADEIRSGIVTINEVVYRLSERFITVIDEKIYGFQQQLHDLKKYRDIMAKKMKEAIEYFAEDASTCDTSKIFSVLEQFISAIKSSKAKFSAARSNK